MQKNTKNTIAIIIIIILLILIIYFVADYNKAETGIGGTKEPLFGELNLPTKPIEKIPSGAISINISRNGFEPKEFDVSSGKIVNVALTGIDGTHSLVFEDEVLINVKIYVGRNETRGISFLAPKVKDYIFYCDIPGHRTAGETGLMHVK